MTGKSAQSANDSLDRAHAAFKAVFGSSSPSGFALLGGGISGACPYRVDVGNRRYLIRVEGHASPLRNPYQYESMSIASEAGIAPKVHFIDRESRVAVTDFIDAKPLAEFVGGSAALVEGIGSLLGRLANIPPFPRFIDYSELVGRLWWWVCQTGLFAEGVLDAASDRFEAVRRSYIWETDLTSSHNDPTPGNILYDGTRLWCIDWESAYLNDPLIDLAIALDNFAQTPALEKLLVQGWQRQRAKEVTQERLAEARALARLYYAGVFFSAAAEGGISGDEDCSPPSIKSVVDRIRAKRITTGSPVIMHALGKLYLGSFMTGKKAPPVTAFVEL